MLLMPFGVVAPAKADAPQKRRVHLKDVYIAGTQYHDMARNEDLARFAPGDPLQLKREPGNPHDEYAIQVLTRSGEMVGYIPRHQNRTVARIMDQGVEVVASIDRIAPDDSPWRRVWIKVEEKV
jgi:hypothetical protein